MMHPERRGSRSPDPIRRGRRRLHRLSNGSLATLDGPTRAVACAASIVDALGTIGLRVRAGVHTGEVEVAGETIRGLGVHIASRVMEAAADGGVVVSRTVKDLVVGSGLEFEDLGEFRLKGVPEGWQLFRLPSS